VNGSVSATHASLGTTAYPTLGGNWLTIHSPTFDGSIGDNHPDPDGGILFTNQSSNGSLPWGYYMGVVKDVASTNGTTQRFDIGKSYDLNSQNSSGHADTLTPYLTIDNGNVGINNTNPAFPLTIGVGDGNKIQFNQDGTGITGHNITCSSGWQFNFNAGRASEDDNAKIAFHISGSSGYDEMMRVTDTGVGIGTTNPHCPLQVNGTGGYIQAQYYQRFRYDHTISGANQWGGLGGISIYGSNEIVSGSFFVSHNGSLGASDQRIKKNIVDADDAECLDVLRQLKPKKYEYKDVVKKGEEPVWGFIAQEVANVLPHATQLRQEFIPNIYELANVSSSNVITFTDFNTSNLESNALIRTKGIDGEDHDIHLEEVIDEHTIRVKEDLTLWIGSVDETGNAVAGNQLFVYGQEVDDFAFLKKEAIWTVATSALQEVDRIQQQLVDQVADLEAANDAKERRIDDLEERLNALVARMEAVENA